MALAPTPVEPVVSAWGAKSAWGKRSSSEAAPKLKEGEEECNICFEAAIDVKFVPCNHGACTSCVDQLRAAAVFKVWIHYLE